MDLLQSFHQNWQKQCCHLSPNNCHLILAVSGGLDSVVLVDLIAKEGFDFTIAHCNFQLRGDESIRDEQFVRTLGGKYAKQVLVQQFDTFAFAESNKLSIQEAARKLRYNWFEELVNGPQSTDDSQQTTVNRRQSTDNSQQHTHHSPLTTHLLTAHHANDNIETLLFNFFRGTGISGLHGIAFMQEHLLRPLLFAKRNEIEAYAQKHNLTWVEDSSNAQDKYSRNYLRHQVLPFMQTIFPSVEDNLLNNIERLAEVEQLYNQAIAIHKHKLLVCKRNELHIPVLKLKKAKPLNTIIWELIKDFGFTAHQVAEVVKLLDANTGSFVQSHTHRIILNRNWLIIAAKQSQLAQHILIEQADRKVSFEEGQLLVEQLPADNYTLKSDNHIAAIDAVAISFPLLLRKPKAGDYFYPLGMSKKKKLSRFFIDQKLSATQKEHVWVLESNKKIIWIVGLRLDNRAKVTTSTKNIVQLQWLPV
jgi:tRNA(Ile)-lysidine synthase